MALPRDTEGPGASGSHREDVDAEALVGELLAVENEARFTTLLLRHPEVLGPEVRAHLEQMATVPGYGAHFVALGALLRDAAGDPHGAWTAFERHIVSATALGQEVESTQSRVETAVAEGRLGDALSLLENSIAMATRAGLGFVVSDLHGDRGRILLRGGVADRAAEVEAAGQEFELGLACAGPPEQTANLLMHLGLAFGERVFGDRGENGDRSVGAIRDALELLEDDSPPEIWAIMRTNLAKALLGRENGDRRADLTEAAELCRAALEYRSPDRNAYDWAHSELNLGLILEELAALGEVPLRDARAAWQRVIAQSDRCEPWLVGYAHFLIGQNLRIAAEPTIGEREQAWERDEDPEADPQALKGARDHLQVARTLLDDAPDPLTRGRALDNLADVLESLDDLDQSIEVGREAVQILRPTSSPRDCARASGRLGAQWADRGEWRAAAEAYRTAVDAAELTIHGRLDTHTRAEEAKRIGNLTRWASFCIGRDGRPLEAALVLENGRTREIRRRLGGGLAQQEALDQLPNELREAYVAASADLSASPLDGSGSSASRRLQEVITEIRSRRGFEQFATGTHAADLAGAPEPTWPLLYVNPTPYGTMLLLLKAGDGQPQVESSFLDVTSTELFMRLMIGDAAERREFDESAEVGSYLFGISTEEQRDLRVDLEQALPWIGENLARPIWELVATYGAHGLTLVPCGPLGVAPLHAAPWSTPDGEFCLLDQFDVRFAPSGIVTATSIVRAQAAQRSAPRLLAFANPTGDLDAAGPEVGEIARRFPRRRQLCFEGDQAVSAMLADHGADATHIHFACHARGGLFDASQSAIVLADRDVSALELTALTGLDTRLVAISACQSAMAEIAEMADEVMSIGTAVLAAGSACVIATLWPVDDAAAALMMTRMYEELDAADLTPPQALRRAQLWLRDLTEADESAFLSEHPLLEAEFRRRSAQGRLPGRRGGDGGRPGATYSHPDYWAPFIASGA